jgi:hypothetical protein
MRQGIIRIVRIVMSYGAKAGNLTEIPIVAIRQPSPDILRLGWNWWRIRSHPGATVDREIAGHSQISNEVVIQRLCTSLSISTPLWLGRIILAAVLMIAAVLRSTQGESAS